LRPTVNEQKKERIAKFLARAGVASRRECEALIAAGRVTLNGAAVIHPATLVDGSDHFALDGKAIAARQPSRLWRYHKPTGLVMTMRDPEGRPTVFASLPKTMPRVASVGRLDLTTEGLLLLTNDGGLARYLEHPTHALARTYRVRVFGNADSNAIARLRRGLTIEGVHYRPIEAIIDRRSGANCWLTMTLREGKNREIRKVLEHLGLRVTRLIRTGYGPFRLDDLPRGAVAEVAARELRKLMPDYFA
jgi:23S rRNA pseudouridine2605 synthase